MQAENVTLCRTFINDFAFIVVGSLLVLSIVEVSLLLLLGVWGTFNNTGVPLSCVLFIDSHWYKRQCNPKFSTRQMVANKRTGKILDRFRHDDNVDIVDIVVVEGVEYFFILSREAHRVASSEQSTNSR
jgi:hypothetical protein